MKFAVHLNTRHRSVKISLKACFNFETKEVVMQTTRQWDFVSATEEQFFEIILQAAPYIAQVAGGDVVIFDESGLRRYVIRSDGSLNTEYIGTHNELCENVMEEMRASIGPSTLTKGATAVRIPLNKSYGIAFNNGVSVQRQDRLLQEARRYQTAHYHLENIIGTSDAMYKAKDMVARAAKSSSTVLIYGETGTGKELFAHAVHNASERSTKPFIALNCGALPESLIESLLFGYQEGAFTGAKKGGQIGVFEQAQGGTLFLDEISEMPFNLQVRLLRVLQEGEVTRLGEHKSRRINVRLVASTNRDLPGMIAQGLFRADLYYRLNVLSITIPPLRERMGDIPALVNHFVHKYAGLLNKNPQDISAPVLEAFCNYDWPGNVREVQNYVEYAINMLDKEDATIAANALPPALAGLVGQKTVRLDNKYDAHLAQSEKELFVETLKRNAGNKCSSAKELGLSRTTFWRKLKKYGLG